MDWHRLCGIFGHAVFDMLSRWGLDMKIMVLLRRCIDYRVQARLNAEGSGVQTDGVKMSTNPFDEIALEAALQLKEAGHAQQVSVVALGGPVMDETLRAGLAMGADDAIRLEHALESMSITSTVSVLTGFLKQQKSDCFLLGKQAIDDDQDQLGQMCAAQLSWPQACFAADIACDDTGMLTVTCEADEGLMVQRLPLPAVITADLRLAEPRFIALPNIMRAKQKPLQVIACDSLLAQCTPDHSIISYATPAARTAGEILPDLDSLLKTLKSKELLP